MTMSIGSIEIPSPQPKTAGQSQAQLRNAAVEFEAVLLRQLTAAMNTTGEVDSGDGDGDDQLFGSDGGSGLAKQMFSEQLASTMAKSGGVGVADMIMKQVGAKPPLADTNSPRPSFKIAAAAAKEIRGRGADSPVYRGVPYAESFLFETPTPVARPAEVPIGDPNEAQVISTAEDQLRADGIDDSLKNLVLDGHVVNTTRSRLAPNAPVRVVASSDMPTVTNGADLQYRLPVSGRQSSGFGNRFHPIDKKIKFHAGLDLAVPLGTPVQASADGVVSFAGKSDGYGNLVVISHPDGRETRYGHLSRIDVAVGSQVSAGQEIALSGSTGKSTGPHVHFEIRENGVAIDPSRMVTKGLPHRAER